MDTKHAGWEWETSIERWHKVRRVLENDQFISGMINYPNGSTYLGEMVNYARHGQGTFTFPDKSQYKGPWINNMKNGRGQYYFSNGD